MKKKIFGFIYFKLLGWKYNFTVPIEEKSVICVAPHTTNWDFILGQLYSGALGMKINFLMKKEWFFFPLGILFKSLGGIPVVRHKHTSMSVNMAETAKAVKTFHLCITPEGTRSPNPDWKKGFYFIALKAGIPILLYGVDYEKKHIQCTKTIIPTGDLEADMRDIKLYFKDFKGKYPENFTIGNIS